MTQNPSPIAIAVSHLRKTYGNANAVEDVSFVVYEAERLCDRVALIDRGRIMALDTPDGLAEAVTGGKQVRFVPSKPFDDRLLKALPEVKTGEAARRAGALTASRTFSPA